MNKNYNYIRIWIKISSLVGMFIMGVVIVGYFYLVAQVGKGQTNKNIEKYLVTKYSDFNSSKMLLLVFLMWSAIKTFVCNIGLIRYASLPDEEFVANKWSLAVLSLTIGGFLAPFMLTRLPNIDVRSTKNARVTIVRYMGTSWYGAALFTALSLFIVKSVIPTSGQTWGNAEGVFYGVFGGMLGIAALIFAITFPFYSEKAPNSLKTQGNYYGFYKTIAWIFIVIVTIELIFQIITTILKVLESFAKAGQGNGMTKIMNMMAAFFNLIYAIFMIYIIISVIKGLWKSGDEGIVHIKQNDAHVERVHRQELRNQQ